MFAILIYDTHEKKVYLFRDPSGQKHLYYYVKNSDVVICLEINLFVILLKITILMIKIHFQI